MAKQDSLNENCANTVKLPGKKAEGLWGHCFSPAIGKNQGIKTIAGKASLAIAQSQTALTLDAQ